MTLAFIPATTPLPPNHGITSWTLYWLLITMSGFQFFIFRLELEVMSARAADIIFANNRHDEIPFSASPTTICKIPATAKGKLRQ
jgi:hypothetical protein